MAIYYRQEPETGRYYAFQITDIDDKGDAVYLLLDWFGRRPPVQVD